MKQLKIAICGNIGVGKSTLCQNLADEYTSGIYMKEELENPYLEKFYEHMAKKESGANPHSFNLQKYFLLTRFEKMVKWNKEEKIWIQDRFLVEQFEIFVKTMVDDGLMKKEDLQVFKTLYQNLVSKVDLPDVIVFLKSDLEKNINRICKRGRECEVDKIDKDYLFKLHQKYESFLKKIKSDFSEIHLIEIDTNSLNSDEVFSYAKMNIDSILADQSFN
jgi:deoxyadenosine/deoxycytidine kinase